MKRSGAARSGAARKVTMQDTTTAAEGGSVTTYETKRLIASNKVEGTAVCNRAGERLGEVYNFMVDKYSGRVAYAVMSFGGRPSASHIPAGVALPISE